MPYFPAFIDISHKNVLIVGGGKVATRKAETLIKFTKNIKVVAPKVREELMELIKKEGLILEKRPFRSKDLEGIDMVVVAVDKISLQKRIFKLCEKRRTLCNSVDSPEFCNFIFPSIIKRGEVTIGISTGGKAPALSRRIRELIEKHLPADLESVLSHLVEERERLPKGENRQKHLIDLARKLIPFD